MKFASVKNSGLARKSALPRKRRGCIVLQGEIQVFTSEHGALSAAEVIAKRSYACKKTFFFIIVKYVAITTTNLPHGRYCPEENIKCPV